MEASNLQVLEDHELYKQLLDNTKTVKAVQGIVPFNDKLKTLDVSLKARAFKEDEIFASSKFFRRNIRRGLSFVEEEGQKITLLRRGLEKFFDIRTEYFDVLEGKSELSAIKIPRVEKDLYNVILDDVVNVLNNGGKVLVYKTEKANGENAQISYSKRYDAWIVASKNVSILVRTKDDVEDYRKYPESRYSFAIMIADAWFNLLKTRVKDIEGLKKELDGRTLIGEYCGHPMHQHLVAYPEITIFFFASVELRGTFKTCNTMKFTEDLLKKYDLPMVKIYPSGECSNIAEFVALLKELFKKVSENTIEKDAEGAVIYFETKQDDDHSAEILSLCKLKTLEYRLFRKLREKLKSMIAKEKTIEEQQTAFEKEVKSLTKEFYPPRPLSYYFELANLGFEFAFYHNEVAKKLGLTHRFLSFLNILRDCKEKNKKPTEADFKEMLETANTLSEESDIEGENN